MGPREALTDQDWSPIEPVAAKAIRAVSGLSVGDQEDVLTRTKTVFLTRVRKDGLRSVENPVAWTCRVAFNAALKRAKEIAAVRAREVSIDGSETLPDRLVSPELSPDQAFDRKETAELLFDWLDALPELERRSVELCIIDGLTEEEATVELGVENRYIIHRAKQKGLEKLLSAAKKHGRNLIAVRALHRAE